MKVTVGANSLSIVHRGSGGISTATLPDVCMTPPSGAPVPYPNVAESRDLERGSTTVKMDGGCSVATARSRLATSRGGEPGTLGGVGSGVNRGPATFLTYSFDVQVEGDGVCRLTDKMLHNGGNTVNCSGIAQEQVVAEPDADPSARASSVAAPAALVVEVVTKADGGAEQPVKNARVQVEGHGRERERLTNDKGLAHFELPPGEYRVDVHRRGFDDVHGHGQSARPKGTRRFELVVPGKPARLPAYGIHNPFRDPTQIEAEAATAAAHNMRYMRINVGIYTSQTPEEQTAYVASIASNIKLLAKHGVVALPTLTRTADGQLIGPAEDDAAGRAQWKGFVSEICAALKPGGTAWSGGSDACAVRCWEVWNEPNLENFWPNPDPERFLVTLRDTRDALREADPGARIVFGGLSQLTRPIDPVHFLEAVANKGGKGLFDAVAIHPYADAPGGCIATVGSIYRSLKRLGLTGKDPKTDVQIWITEVGWAVPNPPGGKGGLIAKDPADQARRIGELARLIEEKRELWRLGPTFWYCYYDYDSDITWAANCGIFDAHQRAATPNPDGSYSATSEGPRRPAAKMVKKAAAQDKKLRKVPLPHLR